MSHPATNHTAEGAEHAGLLAGRAVGSGGWFLENATVASTAANDRHQLSGPSGYRPVNEWDRQLEADVVQEKLARE
jgi:hypothetical protein